MTQKELLDFLKLVSVLKSTPRHCVTSPGRTESVADHCWRTALIPMLIGSEFPDVDINKVIKMCLIHDLGEAVTGDIPTFVKTDSDRKTEKTAIGGLLSHLPEEQRAEFSELFAEMEALQTKEAKLYKALDSMEAVISHNESPLETWLPLEYELNFTYGEKSVAWDQWLIELKNECNRVSEEKIKRGE